MDALRRLGYVCLTLCQPKGQYAVYLLLWWYTSVLYGIGFHHNSDMTFRMCSFPLWCFVVPSSSPTWYTVLVAGGVHLGVNFASINICVLSSWVYMTRGCLLSLLRSILSTTSWYFRGGGPIKIVVFCSRWPLPPCRTIRTPSWTAMPCCSSSGVSSCRISLFVPSQPSLLACCLAFWYFGAASVPFLWDLGQDGRSGSPAGFCIRHVFELNGLLPCPGCQFSAVYVVMAYPPFQHGHGVCCSLAMCEFNLSSWCGWGALCGSYCTCFTPTFGMMSIYSLTDYLGAGASFAL